MSRRTSAAALRSCCRASRRRAEQHAFDAVERHGSRGSGAPSVPSAPGGRRSRPVRWLGAARFDPRYRALWCQAAAGFNTSGARAVSQSTTAFPRFESYRHIISLVLRSALARVSKDGHKRDRASGHPSRRRFAPPSTKPNPAWALAQAGSPHAASRGSGFNQFLWRQAPQKLVNWFHPQWVGPIRWGTQDEVCGFQTPSARSDWFHGIDVLRRPRRDWGAPPRVGAVAASGICEMKRTSLTNPCRSPP